MPSQKALQAARERGFIAAGHSANLTDCPYRKAKAGAYRLAWQRGWLHFAALYSEKFEPVCITCDQCGCETLTPDVNNGQDCFSCSNCGYSALNYELIEIANQEAVAP